MPLRTALTDLIPGLEHPIICGGMQYVGYAELAAAVCNAGGLGTITALTQPTPEALRQEIRKMRTLTTRPFAVNVAILPALIPGDYDGYVNVICEEKVAAIEISAGSPRKYMKKLRAAGVKVIHKSATVAHALKAEALGVDLIEIAGFEASIAGYSQADFVGTWVLLPKLLRKLKKSTPVVVSGSTCTGQQLAAALAMGASGVVMGTRFLATTECPIRPEIKAHLIKPEVDEYSTTVVLGKLRNGTRVMKNKVSKQILKLENGGGQVDFSKFMELAAGARTKRMLQESGDAEDAMWSCGQGVGLVESIVSVREVIDTTMQEAEVCLRNASGRLVAVSQL